ncbi:MAG: antibiotic biosynthesis monooxygenase family protein [Thermoplasmatota archaeon]
MYVGVIFYRFKTGEVKKGVKEWEEMVLREAKRQQGFIKAEMFVDERTGEGLDIGFWETEEDAKRFQETGLFDLLAQGLKPYLSEPPRRQQFKLILSV